MPRGRLKPVDVVIAPRVPWRSPAPAALPAALTVGITAEQRLALRGQFASRRDNPPRVGAADAVEGCPPGQCVSSGSRETT